MRAVGREEQACCIRHFDDAAEIHDRGAAADVLDEPKIVSDEEIGQAQFLLQVDEKVHDLCLDGDIERRHRLVGDDQRRVERERAGDTDALPLSTAEFVRISVDRRWIQSDEAVRDPAPARARSSRLPILWMMSGSSMICRTRIRGFSEE